MKNGFYMGYDASGLTPQQILCQAQALLDEGWYAAGYQTVEVGVRNAEELCLLKETAENLRTVGFRVGVEAGGECTAEEIAAMISALGAQRVTLCHAGDNAHTEDMLRSLPKGVSVSLRVEEKDLAWAAQAADTVILESSTLTGDFFEVTRNQLDSCRDGDTDTAKSTANLRNACLKEGGRIALGPLPLRFDYYRNEAIFLQLCMLGCPLILKGDVRAVPKRFADLAQNPEVIHVASCVPGCVLRYYDPWHILMGKPDGEKYAYALLLNRCHGDQPTDLKPADLGWEGRFRIVLWPENVLAGAMLESYEIHLETSDHPQTPCCRLVRAERL